MLGHRELTVHDYTRILKRRALLVSALAIAGCLAGLVATYLVPAVYESQTLVLVQQQQVPDDYVKPLFGEDLAARLASMKEQILSRSRIEPIVSKYNLFAGANASIDDRIERARKAIKITELRSGSAKASGGIPGFYIAFDASDPHTAQLVCSEIASLFVSDNLQARQQSAEGTTVFLKQQLNDAKQALDVQDQKLAGFERKYLGRLPQQEDSNASTLQALTMQLDSVAQNISRIQEQESFLQALLAQRTGQPASSQPVFVPPAPAHPLKKQLLDLQAQKKALLATYTPDYPDVIAISNSIHDLEVKMGLTTAAVAAEAPAPTASSLPGQTYQLLSQLRSAQLSMTAAKLQQARLQHDVQVYESRVEQSPVVEQQYKQIMRDHDDALEFYNSLLTKMNDSTMSEALEERQQGEQFHVMDAANLPQEPKFPKRLNFLLGGLGGGLMSGLCLAVWFEFRDEAVYNELDLWAGTELPTLANIPLNPSLPPVKMRRKRMNKAGEPLNPTGNLA